MMTPTGSPAPGRSLETLAEEKAYQNLILGGYNSSEVSIAEIDSCHDMC